MQQKFSLVFSIIILFQCTAFQRIIAQSISTIVNDSAKIQQQHGIDPNAPLTARIGDTPPEVITLFHEAGMAPVQHQLSDAEQKIVLEVIDNLPSLHKEVLKNHLRRLSFLDNMPNTALTSTVNPDDSFKVFDLTIRAAILQQTVSEWLTEKEYNCFDTTDSNIRLYINAGKLNALQYVLLHEATHIVDGARGITPADRFYTNEVIPDTITNQFIKGVWIKRTELHPKYQDSLLNNIAFQRGGKKMPIKDAVTVYKKFAKTPFASLYSLSSWHEDLAEYTTIAHFTKELDQPFQIVVYRGNKSIFKYKPMKSKIVKGRLSTRT